MDPQLSSATYSASPKMQKETWKHALLLSFQSLGVIYGRLGTAPLYVFWSIPTEDFKSKEHVYELFSFIFWTLTIISLLKYAFIVLRADDEGEGGTFALYSLLCRHAKVGLLPNDGSSNGVMHYEAGSPFRVKKESRARRAIKKHKKIHYLMLLLAVSGSCMMIGDAVLTPALSVLSAVSGFHKSLADIKVSSSPKKQEKISEDLEKYLPVSLACVILLFLFTLQHYGTRKIGSIFALVVIVWLLFIGGVGTYNIVNCDQKILSAISPIYLYRFFRGIDRHSWRSLSSIVLCVAGSEAMFADLGHFSTRSIKSTFISLIYPVLILCYAGQAAFISTCISRDNVPKHFNSLSTSVPKNFRHVFIVVSLLASAVGSQATITACFSVINQCLALGCFPRVKVVHTSDKIHGQIYIPDINWLLMILSLSVTIGFHDVARIANATGLAIICGMLVTTCLMSLVIALYWEKSLPIAACFLMFFGTIEAMYLSACILNFHKGAWYLVALSALSLIVMVSWHYGTMKKYEFDIQNKVSTEWLTDLSEGLGVSRIPGIGFIYTDIVTGIPAFFSHFITNLPAFHQVLIFVSSKSLPVPFVPPSQRYLIGRVGPKEYRIYRCIVRHGYCDRITDKDDFEEHIFQSIGEFISMEEKDLEATSSEGQMIVVGKPLPEGNALVPVQDSYCATETSSMEITDAETPVNPLMERGTNALVKRKRVRFMLPENSPKMRVGVREELQELIDARESGTAYFLGQSHLVVRDGSNFLKRLLIMIYVFCDRNGRDPHVVLNIPHAAIVEVGMIYTI